MKSSLQAAGRTGQEWLVVHYGDPALRGSERCLLNLLQARHAAGLGSRTVLWCNQASLAEAAAPFVDEVLLTDFQLGPGLGQARPEGGHLRHWRGLVAQGRALVQRRGTGLLYCNGLGPCQWMVPVSLLQGLPLLTQLHTNYLPGSRLASLAYGASLVLGVSGFCVQGFAEDGLPAAQRAVVPNGVAVPQLQQPRAAVRAALGIAPQTLLLASIGALVDWKRVDLLLAALQALPADQRAQVHLLVVGAGPEEAALRAQAAGLPVSFTGWRTDIGDLLQAADVLVTAASKEAFGLTVAEAAALGRPALAAAAGGLPEVVADGRSGLLFESGSATACAAAIGRLLQAPALRAELGAGAAARYAECFTVGQMTGRILALADAQAATGPGRWRRSLTLLRCSLQAVCKRLKLVRP